MLCLQAFGQPSLPPPGGGCTNCPPNTNTIPGNIYVPLTGILNTTGSESLLIDTIPTVPDSTQALASWATIHSGGITVDTNGFIVDTNPNPSDNDGLPTGTAVGVVLISDTNNPFVITRGQFNVLLTNLVGELQNTRFEVKIMRNTNDFSELFNQEMALAEYDTNSTNMTLTPISGTSNTNLYSLSVQFPPCVWSGARLISIRTEPLDFDLPFAQLQWLMVTNIANAPATFTTDQSRTLVLQTNTPAMRIWTKTVSGVGLNAQTGLTAGEVHLFTIPGTVITTSTDATDVFQDGIWPDEMGFGNVDATQTPVSFFGVRVDSGL
jgi:hypothetical protein